MAVPGGVRLALHIQPRASRTELAGVHGGALKVRVTSPPVAGAANLELIRFLALRLGVTRSRVELVSGMGSKRKGLLIHGVSVEQAKHALGL